MHWETKKKIDSIYSSICLIVVVWNWTHNISEVCLYLRFKIYIEMKYMKPPAKKKSFINWSVICPVFKNTIGIAKDILLSWTKKDIVRWHCFNHKQRELNIVLGFQSLNNRVIKLVSITTTEDALHSPNPELKLLTF